jgi:toxin FitB
VAGVLLDTSMLVGGEAVAPDLATAISVVSIAELHFGVLVARDDDERARRLTHLAFIELRYADPLVLSDVVARERGRLEAAVTNRGGSPRRRVADLAIAATARVHGVTLLTPNIKDFSVIDDLVDVATP